MENKLPVLYAVRGYSSIPDSNLEALPGVSESVIRINKYMGGACLHKTDREGCPIYIERLVKTIKEIMTSYNLILILFFLGLP